MIRSVTRSLLVVGLLILVACAGYRVKEQRVTQGPMAEDLFMTRGIMANGKEPNFDERRHWYNQVDTRISQYLIRHPEVASSWTCRRSASSARCRSDRTRSRF